MFRKSWQLVLSGTLNSDRSNRQAQGAGHLTITKPSPADKKIPSVKSVNSPTPQNQITKLDAEISFLPTNDGLEGLRLPPNRGVSAELLVWCCGTSLSPIQTRQCDGGNSKIGSRPLINQTLMHPSKSYSIILIGVAVILLTTRIELSAQTPSVSSSNPAPNIIFILADDQSWNGTSVQMHPNIPDSKSDFYRTPNLEKLAAEGMRFSQAYSPGPMCSPTRASLQTGKSPAQLGMTNVGGGRQRPVSQSQKLILP
jgi:hypothetical protein